jgi:DNA-binding HxlR family transcriptional regulator
MSRTPEPRACTIASTLEVVGERWSLLVLRETFYGMHRFDEIQQHTGAPRDVLTKRLRTLVEEGILEKRPYQSHPARYEYHPTRAGEELRPVLILLNAWGARWRPVDGADAMVIEHEGGHPIDPVLRCAACGKEIAHRNISVLDTTRAA